MNGNISNIKNSIYKFSFSLAKIGVDTKSHVFIPIPKGMIRYLEIEDNLANIGYTGTVIFNNFYGILDKLGLGSGISDSTTLFDINIENLEFRGTNLQDNSIQTIAILQNNTDPSNNSIDKSIIYNFEEYSVNLLKQKKSEPSNVSGKIVGSIYTILENCFIGGKVIDKNSFDELNSSSNEMSIERTILKTSSYYDYIKILYKYLLLTGKNNSPGILQLENYVEPYTNQSGGSSERVIRKFTIRPLFDKIRSLTGKLKLNEKKKDLREEVLEQFTIGGESDKPTYRENSIESVTVLRPDFKTLYEDKWVNYTGVTTLQNLTDVISLNLTYDNLRTTFEQNALDGDVSNLPIRSDIKSDSTLEKVIAFDYPIVNDNNLLEQGITSMIYKSFIYDNTAVVFTTLGNPYRKPGRFIMLNGSVDNQEDTTSSVTGYWFIIGVKHIFENDIYTNEITAVKIFIEGAKRSTNTSSPANTPTTNTVTPPTRTNTSDFGEPNGNNNTSPSSTLNDAQLPTPSASGNDGPNLLPEIPPGDPVVDSAPNTNPTTITPTSNPSDFSSPNSTGSSSNLNDGQLPTPSPEGYDGPEDSLFLNLDQKLPEGAPFAPDADQSSGGSATDPTIPVSPGIARIEQMRKESLFNIVKVGGVDPAASARIAEQRARRAAILGRS